MSAIPSCLTLNTKQLQLVAQFEERMEKIWDAKNIDRSEPEDCCMSSPYTFEVRASGIGDTVHIVCGTERLWLDDGLEP